MATKLGEKFHRRDSVGCSLAWAIKTAPLVLDVVTPDGRDNVQPTADALADGTYHLAADCPEGL